MAIENDLEFILAADKFLYEYMCKNIIMGIKPKGSKHANKEALYKAIISMLNGNLSKIGGKDVTGVGWVTEGAIKKGVNRLLASKFVMEFPGDNTEKLTIKIDQLRSLIGIGIAEGYIERETVEYATHPEIVTFYRLTSLYFHKLLKELNIPPYEVYY